MPAKQGIVPVRYYCRLNDQIIDSKFPTFSTLAPNPRLSFSMLRIAVKIAVKTHCCKNTLTKKVLKNYNKYTSKGLTLKSRKLVNPREF